MEIVLVYQKKRKDFGKFLNLTDKSFPTTDISPDPSYITNFTLRNPCNSAIQTSVEKSEHEVNTDSVSYSSTGILHVQGGWPKDVDSTDAEHTIRYRKKVEKDEEYMKSVKTMGESIEHCIKQNNAIDIYEEYFKDKAENLFTEPPSAKSVNVFRDPAGGKVQRTASSVSWYPDDGRKIAVAYSVLEFQTMDPNMCMDSYIWDIEKPAVPDFTLSPASPIVSLEYNTKDPHTLVGGCYNGQVAFWDTRKGSNPVDSSLIEKSHRDPVYNVSWVSSKSGTEFFSVATDGYVLWWDTRKLSEPTETMLMDPEKNGKMVGGTVLDFESTMPTKYMVGTENGSIFMCNKKAKNPNEKIIHIYQGFHHGPIYSLQRNPFFTKNFLSVGDWTAKIWAEDVKAPILTTGYSNTYMTYGCWSTTRPSVFYTGKKDGTFDAWDYTLKYNEPCLTVKVSDAPIKCIRVQDRGGLLAATSTDGSTAVYQLSESLIKPQNNEKNVFSQIVERENRREKTLEGIAREKRLKAQQKMLVTEKEDGKLIDGMSLMMRDIDSEFNSATR